MQLSLQHPSYHVSSFPCCTGWSLLPHAAAGMQHCPARLFFVRCSPSLLVMNAHMHTLFAGQAWKAVCQHATPDTSAHCPVACVWRTQGEGGTRRQGDDTPQPRVTPPGGHAEFQDGALCAGPMVSRLRWSPLVKAAEHMGCASVFACLSDARGRLVMILSVTVQPRTLPGRTGMCRLVWFICCCMCFQGRTLWHQLQGHR